MFFQKAYPSAAALCFFLAPQAVFFPPAQTLNIAAVPQNAQRGQQQAPDDHSQFPAFWKDTRMAYSVSMDMLPREIYFDR